MASSVSVLFLTKSILFVRREKIKIVLPFSVAGHILINKHLIKLVKLELEIYHLIGNVPYTSNYSEYQRMWNGVELGVK